MALPQRFIPNQLDFGIEIRSPAVISPTDGRAAEITGFVRQKGLGRKTFPYFIGYMIFIE